ncbi:MAG TPA: shikimate kinase [Ignavibacteriaceae bacterium]
MASGKSTIGPILANTLGWDHFDLDREIEKAEGKKIKEIFKSKGEQYFRKIETNLLKKLSGLEKVIISLGGGTIADPENFKIIKSTGYLIYLKSSPEIAFKRLQFKRDRPNILLDEAKDPTREEIMERIKTLFNNRKKYYEQADYILDTDKEPVGKSVDKISKFISSSRMK